MTMLKKGLIHVYYGYGKGKTTAALGLAVRASGRGLPVVIVQFLKDMATGELTQLERLPDVTVLRGTACKTFVRDMTPEQIEETRRIHNDNLRRALEFVGKGECGMLVLDELMDACLLDVVDMGLVHRIVDEKPECLELVITGHDPIDWIVERADYVTEMRKCKHPYDCGVMARKGIEF